MSVFASIQQVLNVFNQLYARLGPFSACLFLFLLWCQYQNWTVYLNGGVVQCKSVDNLTKEQVNNRCWEQMVSDCSTRGALIRFFTVVEKVKGRAFLGDRLAELEGEGGRAFLLRVSRSMRKNEFQPYFDDVRDWKGIALPHRPCSACTFEATKWFQILNCTQDVGRALFRSWLLEKVKGWEERTKLLHPLLAGVEIGKSRALLRALEELNATNDLRDLLYMLWGELATGGAAAVIEAVVDETERTRARKDELGNDHGQACPYVFLSYQYLEFAVMLMVFHATVYSLPGFSPVHPEVGLQELTVRLREAEKLDKAKLRDKLGEIVDDLPYFAVHHRAHDTWIAAFLALSNTLTYAIMSFLLFLVVFDSNELVNDLRYLPSRLFWLLSGGVPWNKVSYPVAGFPRFRKCTLGRMTATGVDKVVVSCELSLDALNATALSCIVKDGALVSVMFAILRIFRLGLFSIYDWCFSFVSLGQGEPVSLVLLNMSGERYWRCSQEIAKKCSEDELRLLSLLQRRVGLVVSRELVYVLGHKLSLQEGRRRRDEAANLDRIYGTSDPLDLIPPIFIFFIYQAPIVLYLGSAAGFGADGQPVKNIMHALGLLHLARYHPVILPGLFFVSHSCLLWTVRYFQSYFFQRALLKISDGHRSGHRQEYSALIQIEGSGK